MSTAAIVLSAGKGSRMRSEIKKQYMDLCGRPVLYYSLAQFDRSDEIDRIILVCGEGEEDWCRREFAGRYGIRKLSDVTAGGRERYDSVRKGLACADGCDIVMIHDGARPFVTDKLISDLAAAARLCGACTAAVPARETIKVADKNGYIKDTPPRSSLWIAQTPQAFSYEAICRAYRNMSQTGQGAELSITDDAMVMERYGDCPVRLVEGSYTNIKITVPEDMTVAASILKQKSFSFSG